MKLLALQIIIIIGLAQFGGLSPKVDSWIKSKLYHFIEIKAQESKAMIDKLNRLTNQSFSSMNLSSSDVRKEFVFKQEVRSQEYSFGECLDLINYFVNRGNESRRLIDSIQQEYKWRLISEWYDDPGEQDQLILIRDEQADTYEWHFKGGNVEVGKAIEMLTTQVDQLEKVIIKTDNSQTNFIGNIR